MAKPRHIKDLLHKDNCEYLTAWLHQCVENKEAINDTQCPKSWAMGHHPVTDKLLEEMTSRMEEETGKKLFPTYAYARLYQKGEILECHTDRPSCEYSVTINLGFDGKNWPIFTADAGEETDQGIKGAENKIWRIKNVQEFELNVGDALVYQGGLSPHWREEFTGEWQAQVFLHWVDQDGPHAEWKYDKRPCLAHHDQLEQSVPNRPEEVLYWYVPNAIADISCDQMMQKFESAESHKASVGTDNGQVDLSIRDVNKISITHEVGIGATLTGMGFNINKRAWNFDVTHSNQSEYLKYDADGHYKTHVDTFCCPGNSETRKITMLAFLNDDFEGGRLYLENGYERIYPPQEKGTVLAFPSFINHGVEPVTKGIRRSIVTWLVGPWFR
jgi:hypothetical protein